MNAQPPDALALIWPRAGSTPLPRFVLLAALLHIWLVLLLGNAPGGTAREGAGVFGRLNITLQAAERGVASDLAPSLLPAPPATPTGPTGEAERSRFGGAVRETMPDPSLQPGAAELGDWSPVRRGQADARPDVATQAPGPAAVKAEENSATPVRSLPSALKPSPPVAPLASPQAPLPAPTLPAVPAAPDVPVDVPVVVPVAVPLRPITPPLALPPAMPLPAAALSTPAADKQLNARLPGAVSAASSALSETGRVATAPALGAVPAPSLPAAPTQASAVTPPQPAPSAADTTTVRAQANQPGPPEASAAPVAPAHLAAPARSGPAPALAGPAAQGAPDAGSRVGVDVATAPSTPASAPKRLNLELPRLRGGELSRHSSTGLLPALPRPPEVPDKLSTAIERAAKEDCRKAYSGAGLLAVVPLAVDALRDGGCKW